MDERASPGKGQVSAAVAKRPLRRHSRPGNRRQPQTGAAVGLVRGAPEWAPPLPPWRLRLASSVQYALYAVLLGQALSGALAIYLWWPSSALHKALFWALVVLLALHLSGAALSFAARPRETLFRITGLRQAG